MAATPSPFFISEVSAHKKGVQPTEDRRRIALWAAVLREIRDVRAIDAPTLDRFVRDRRAGRISVLGEEGKPLRLAKKPSDTTIGGELVFLNRVLNWACKVRTPDGGRLLQDNPLCAVTRSRRAKTRNGRSQAAIAI